LGVETELPKDRQERGAYRGIKTGFEQKVTPEQQAAAEKSLNEESKKAADKLRRSFAQADLGNLKLLSDAAKDGTTNLEKLTKSFDSVTAETAQYARKMAALAGILEQITVEEIKEKLVGELTKNANISAPTSGDMGGKGVLAPEGNVGDKASTGDISLFGYKG
jgi:hypothetical protein